jgi:hypothetical protein
MVEPRRTCGEGHVILEVTCNAYWVLMGKPNGKEKLGRLNCRREDNNKTEITV